LFFCVNIKMKYYIIKIIFFSAIFNLIAIIGLSKPLYADYSFLNMPIEANQLTLAGAGTASFFGASSIRMNPGAIGFNKYFSSELTHQILNDDFHADSGLALIPISTEFSFGVFFSTVYLKDDFKQVEDFKETSSDLSVSDIEAGFSAGYKILKDLSIGGNLKYIRMQLGPEVAQSFGADLGMYYNLHFAGSVRQYRTLSLGATIKNLGPTVQFYSSSDNAIQPMSIKMGASYGPLKWLNTYLDYGFSYYTGSSVHLGLEFLSNFYVSPRIGVKYDFNGFLVSTGGSIQYGSQYKIQAIGGTSFGSKTESNTFISLQFSKYGFSSIRPIKKSYVEVKEYSLKTIQDYYQPFLLYPVKFKFKVEKVQSVLLNQTSTTGFTQKTWKLKRVAVQPEDERFIKELMSKNIRKIKLTDRKMGLWLNIKGIDENIAIDWWDLFSNIIQSTTDFEVFLGNNLENLNRNVNAPLKYEFKLMVIKDKKTKSVIKTRLYEMYSNQILLSKSFIIEEQKNAFDTLKKISDFYANYLKSIKGFYVLKTLNLKKDSL